jgi:hypothetical protein
MEKRKQDQRESAYVAERTKCTSVVAAARPGIVDRQFAKLQGIVSSESAQRAKEIIRWLKFDRTGSPEWNVLLEDAKVRGEVIIKVSTTETPPLVCDVHFVRESSGKPHMSLAVVLKPHMLELSSVSAMSIARWGQEHFSRALDFITAQNESAAFLKMVADDVAGEVTAASKLCSVIKLLVGLGMLDTKSWVVCVSKIFFHTFVTGLSGLFYPSYASGSVDLSSKPGHVYVAATQASKAIAHGPIEEQRLADLERKLRQRSEDRIARRRRRREKESLCVVQ